MSQQPPTSASKLDAVVDRFDRQWRTNTPPELADFLETENASSGDRRALLIELIAIDLEYRWKNAHQNEHSTLTGSTLGIEPWLLEIYAQHWPELGSVEELPMDLITEEYRVRQRWGDRPSHADYLQRFPGLAKRLQQSLPEVDAELHHDSALLLDTDKQKDTLAIRIGEQFEQDLRQAARGTFQPRDFGRYRLLEVLGRGAMGVVYLAEDTELHRKVALKTPRLEDAGRERIARFLNEARTAAALSHPNLCPVYDVGQVEGQYYITMAYVEGHTLADRLQHEGQLSSETVGELVRKIAEAMQTAHDAGVVHRDLKSSNVMIDARGEPIVMDFGLARRMQTEAEAKLTQSGQVVGSPAYMAPEQVEGVSDAIGPATDVYALGVVLYEMLTGQVPFRGGSMGGVLAQILRDPPPPLVAGEKDIPAELETLCLQMLAKQPEARPSSMQAVAQRLKRIDRQLTEADTQTITQTPTEKPIRRRRIPVGLTIAILAMVGLVGLLLAPLVMRVETPEGEVVIKSYDPDIRVTVKRNGKPVEELTFTKGPASTKVQTGNIEIEIQGGKPDGVRIKNGNFELIKGEKVVVEILAPKKQPVAANWKSLFNGKDLQGWSDLEGNLGNWKIEDGMLTCSGAASHLITDRDDFGDFHLRAEVKINAEGNSGLYFRFKKPLAIVGDYEAQITNNPGQGNKTGSLYGLVRVGESPVLPDTWFTLEILAVGNRIRILVDGEETADYREDRPDREKRGHIAIQHHDPNTRVYFRKIEIRELDGSTEVAPPIPVVKSPFDDLRRVDIPAYELKVAGGGNPAKAPKELVAVFGDSRLMHEQFATFDVDFDPQGGVLASVGHDRSIRFWDTRNGELLDTIPIDNALIPDSIRYSPSGDRVAVSGGGAGKGALFVWDLRTKKTTLSLHDLPGAVVSLAWTPDGKRLIGALDAPPRRVMVWDAATGKELATLTGDFPDVRILLALGPNGKQLVTACGLKVELWDVESEKLVGELKHDKTTGYIRGLAWSPDGKSVAVSAGTIWVWNIPSRKLARTIEEVNAHALAWSPDGKWLAAAGKNGFDLWDTKAWKKVRTLTCQRIDDSAGKGLTFSQDSRLLAWANHLGNVGLWDVDSGKEVGSPRGHCNGVTGVSVSPDGEWTASSSLDRTLRLWKSATGEETARLHEGYTPYLAVAVSPDGKRVVGTGLNDGQMMLWKLPSREHLLTFSPDKWGRICEVDWSSDGKTLALGCIWPQCVRVVSAKTGKELYQKPLPDNTPPPSVAFSPDDQWLAIGMSNTAMLWDAQTGNEIRTIDAPGNVRSLAFSPSGEHLLLAGNFQSPVLVEVETGKKILTLRVLEKGDCVSAIYDKSGTRIATLHESKDRRELVVWDAVTGKRLRSILLPAEKRYSELDPFNRLAFAPDGRHLLVANNNGTIYVLRWQRHETVVGLECLQRSDIPPYELKVAGGGDPANAPKELVAVFGESRLQHRRGHAQSVDFHPDGNVLATVGGDGTLRFWETRNGEMLDSFAFKQEIPMIPDCVVYSPSGDRVAVSGGGAGKGTLFVWNVRTKAVVLTLRDLPGAVRDVAWTPDGKRLIGLTDGDTWQVFGWDAATGREVMALEKNLSGWSCMALSPDGKQLATAVSSEQGKVRLWDAETGKHLADLNPEKPLKLPSHYFFAWSPDGKRLALTVGSAILLWNVESRKPLPTIEKGYGTHLTWSPNGSWLAGCGGISTVVLYDPKTWKELKTLTCSRRLQFTDLAVSRDGRYLSGTAFAGAIVVWDVSTGEEIAVPTGHFNSVTAVAVSPKGKWVASSSHDRTVRLWNSATGKEEAVLRGGSGQFNAVAFSPDGSRLAGAGYGPASGTMVWDVHTRKKQFVVPGIQQGQHVMMPEWSPDGKLLAVVCAYPEKVKVIDATTGQELYAKEMPRLWANVSFHPDGKTLAVWNGEAIAFWDAATGKELRTLDSPDRVYSLAYRPDGKHLLVAGLFPNPVVYDAETGKKVRTLISAGDTNCPVAVYDRQGTRIATLDEENRLTVWDSATGKPLHRISLRQELRDWRLFETDIAFAPDGKHLLVANYNGTVSVLRLP